MSEKPRKEWTTEDVVAVGVAGFGLGALVASIYGSRTIKQINDLTRKSNARQQAFLKDLMERFKPHATLEDMQALQTHADFNLIMTIEDGRDIGYEQ